MTLRCLLQTMVMTSPLHGEGRQFEPGWAHYYGETMDSKYLGMLQYSDVLALLETYKVIYGTNIKIVPNKLVINPIDATEIEIHAGKHAPIWFKKEGSYFKVYSDFMPKGPKMCADCARMCETRAWCRELEDLATDRINMSKRTVHMHKAEA